VPYRNHDEPGGETMRGDGPSCLLPPMPPDNAPRLPACTSCNDELAAAPAPCSPSLFFFLRVAPDKIEKDTEKKKLVT
jgi:hypothetical protein